MAITAARLIYRHIASSVTSSTSNTRRREVLIARPAEVLHLDAIELAPEILDEDGAIDDTMAIVEGSSEPHAIPHKHPMVKVEPSTNRIASRAEDPCMERRPTRWPPCRKDGDLVDEPAVRASCR